MKVIKRFRDKNTKRVFNTGDKYEGSKERVQELQKLGYIEKPKGRTTKKAEGE